MGGETTHRILPNTFLLQKFLSQHKSRLQQQEWINLGEEITGQNSNNQVSCTLLYRLAAEVTIPAHTCSLMCDYFSNSPLTHDCTAAATLRWYRAKASRRLCKGYFSVLAGYSFLSASRGWWGCGKHCSPRHLCLWWKPTCFVFERFVLPVCQKGSLNPKGISAEG